VFVLVLRAFPAEISGSRTAGFNVRRAVLAACVGATVTVLGAFAVAPRGLRRPPAHLLFRGFV
ncbi:hypothetical protein, partial [Nocardia cyriacigeorgica]|uniref:hypothetical protein n=1 Tax=Nocardia cyriacigeorgica TaxID=135487 RepID=UPI0024563ABA